MSSNVGDITFGQDSNAPRWRVARTITVGDILASAVFVVSAFSVYLSVNNRVITVELKQDMLEKKFTEMELSRKEGTLEIKTDLRQLQNVVQDLRADLKGRGK